MPEQLIAAFVVASMLGLSTRTIDNWRFIKDPDDPRRKLLPAHRVGSRIRYRLADVENYIRVTCGEKAETIDITPRKPTDKPARKPRRRAR